MSKNLCCGGVFSTMKALAAGVKAMAGTGAVGASAVANDGTETDANGTGVVAAVAAEAVTTDGAEGTS